METGDPDLAEIGAIFDAWLGGDAASLDEAFGVARAPCQRDPRTIRSLIHRDELVREAVLAWGGVKPFVKAFGRYRAGAWIRDRVERDCPPRLASKPEALLWGILQQRDCSLKRSAVHRIVQNGRRCMWTEDERISPPYSED